MVPTHDEFDDLVVPLMAEMGMRPVGDSHSPLNQDAYVRRFSGEQNGEPYATNVVASGLELMQNRGEGLALLAAARVRTAMERD